MSLQAAKSRRRAPVDTVRMQGAMLEREGRKLISFSCNDYLGLTHHPRVIASAQAATATYGAGAGASRLITGNLPLYATLEAALAEHKKTEAACVFGSGYLANLGAIPALVGPGDLIVADKLVHACMLDAARLSGATVMRFAHNNPEHARLVLSGNRSEHHHCLLMTETVFSMDGDRAPLQALKRLCSEFDAWLMTDDAHGTGWLTQESHADIQMGTLSKGLGSYGGYVCGSRALVDYLKGAARSLIFSTGLPPASLAAAIEALAIIKDEPELGTMALEHAKLFTSLLKMPAAQSPIVPLIIGDNARTLEAAYALQLQGVMVAAIRPPTVPEHSARLRFTFSALHTHEQIRSLAAGLNAMGLPT